jgi:hypothetical protein
MSGGPKRIHIVEPTLESEAGHGHSFVASRCRARFRQFDFATGKM